MEQSSSWPWPRSCSRGQTCVLSNDEERVTLQLRDALDHVFLVRRARAVIAIVDITHGLCEYARFDGADATQGIFVEQRIATDRHLNLCSFHQVDFGIQLLELFQPGQVQSENIIR